MNIPFKNNHRMLVISHCEKEIHNVHGNKTNNVYHWKIFRWKIIEKLDRTECSSNEITESKNYHRFHNMHIIPVIFLQATFLEFFDLTILTYTGSKSEVTKNLFEIHS